MPLLSAPTGRQQIVAKARAEKPSEFVGFHASGPLSVLAGSGPYWPLANPGCKGARHLEFRRFHPHLRSSNVGGAFHHSGADRRRGGWLAARPGAGGGGADPVARAAEGADQQRRGARATGAPVRDPARQGGRGRPTKSASPSPGRRITRRRISRSTSSSRTSICSSSTSRPGWSSIPAAGNFDGTLVNALLHHCAGRLSGHRRGGAAGDRPPDRQGHVGPAGRRQDRRRP